MKQLITATAFLMFGTICLTAQTTKNSTTKLPDKPASSTEMKLKTNTVESNGMNRTIDTSTVNNRSKMQTNPNRLQQNQKMKNNGTLQNPNTTMPNNGTLQNPNTTMPNNGTLQNPNTTMPNNGTLQNPNNIMPNNSTASPQVMPVSPVEGTKPNR